MMGRHSRADVAFQLKMVLAPLCRKTSPCFTGTIRAAASVTLAFLLLGCATPYQPKDLLWGGYRDFQVSTNTFSITFQGNPYLDRSRLRQYLFRRAAEVTLEHGFSHFVILESADQSHTSTYVSWTSLTITATPQETMMIRCLHGDQDSAAANAIDAREYLRLNFSAESVPRTTGTR